MAIRSIARTLPVFLGVLVLAALAAAAHAAQECASARMVQVKRSVVRSQTMGSGISLSFTIQFLLLHSRHTGPGSAAQASRAAGVDKSGSCAR